MQLRSPCRGKTSLVAVWQQKRTSSTRYECSYYHTKTFTYLTPGEQMTSVADLWLRSQKLAMAPMVTDESNEDDGEDVWEDEQESKGEF
jgi:hypothetical protein